MTRVLSFFDRVGDIAYALFGTVKAHPSSMIVAGVVVSLLLAIVGLWALLRARRLLALVPARVGAMEARLDTLTQSTALLTDTTESCFRAISMQLQFLQSEGAMRGARRPVSDVTGKPEGRTSRQRRIVTAAKRGDSVAEIAANEDMSESEIALRLSLRTPGTSGTPGTPGTSGTPEALYDTMRA